MNFKRILEWIPYISPSKAMMLCIGSICFLYGFVVGYAEGDVNLILECMREQGIGTIEKPIDLLAHGIMYFAFFVACLGGYVGSDLQFVPLGVMKPALKVFSIVPSVPLVVSMYQQIKYFLESKKPDKLVGGFGESARL